MNVKVFKSVDPNWPYWAVACPGHETRWFATEAEARREAEKVRTKQQLAALWGNRPNE